MQKLTAFVRSSALYKVVALLVLLGAATLLSATLAINNVNIALLYLLCVLLVCVVTGSNLYGMCAAICCAVLYNLLFLPPVGGFELTRADDLLTIAFYLVVSLVAGLAGGGERPPGRPARPHRTGLSDHARRGGGGAPRAVGHF